MAAKTEDGGYYAIKGFLYQFDKTLVEILENPNTTVSFETHQDINYEDFVLQIKHKETQTFANNKIRKAVIQLLTFFKQNPTKRILLYCHFKDKPIQDLRLSLTQLDTLIGFSGKKLFPQSVRQHFIARFAIRFSEDYKSQFENVLALIMASFSLQSRELAVLHHSIFRSRLLDLSLEQKSNRKLGLQDLRSFLEDVEVRWFEGTYSKYVGVEKYLRLIKNTYFTASTPNIENFERLFIIECDSLASQSDLMKITVQLSKKYFRKGKSPQPFVLFQKIPETRLFELKQMLLDGGFDFFDGTHFDGDRFRIEDLAGNPTTPREFNIKIIKENQVSKLLNKVPMREVFQFFIQNPVDLNISGKDHRRIQIGKTTQILRIIS
ncbi:MAG TPA: hypothetical protein VK709_07845 [Candidatus Saccharimonadales bacterium]|nr:hypothetical protein [Candidatus Saccharimonadales bacterium]